MRYFSSTVRVVIPQIGPRSISRVGFQEQLPRIQLRQLCYTPEQERQDRYKQIVGFMFVSGMSRFVGSPIMGFTLAVLFDNTDIFLGITEIGYSCGLYIGMFGLCAAGPLPPTTPAKPPQKSP